MILSFVMEFKMNYKKIGPFGCYTTAQLWDQDRIAFEQHFELLRTLIKFHEPLN